MLLTIQILSWLGSIGIIGAQWFLATKHRLNLKQLLCYHLVNVFGGVTVGILTYTKEAYQSTLIQWFWAIVSLYAAFKILNNKELILEAIKSINDDFRITELDVSNNNILVSFQYNGAEDRVVFNCYYTKRKVTITKFTFHGKDEWAFGTRNLPIPIMLFPLLVHKRLRTVKTENKDRTPTEFGKVLFEFGMKKRYG